MGITEDRVDIYEQCRFCGKTKFRNAYCTCPEGERAFKDQEQELRVFKELTCSTCGNSYDPDNLPESHPYRHPVNGPVMNGLQEAQSESNSAPRLPSDPILRLVLIEKGLITVEDLNEAEAKLAASGIVITGSRENQE